MKAVIAMAIAIAAVVYILVVRLAIFLAALLAIIVIGGTCLDMMEATISRLTLKLKSKSTAA
jgi:hypothetical protein